MLCKFIKIIRFDFRRFFHFARFENTGIYMLFLWQRRLEDLATPFRKIVILLSFFGTSPLPADPYCFWGCSRTRG